ncbi:BTAD domain-containing putative transcriptional regulator [Kitasatospora indigofera]|uniref:BTAD domain-containing putative transcriptional regulator n=1 Tax=Kitasatospora indigofera TaxID=67307 RepID=UPI0036A46EB2
MGDSETTPGAGDGPAPDGRTPGRGAPARFTVLGLLAIADSRETVVLQPSKPAALLAALLVRPNSVVSVESLQRVIWGEETPATAKAALQTCVLRLRRLFGKYGISGNTIEAVPGGYRMAADAGTLDLLEYRSLLGRAAAAEADPGAELDLLRAALALWQLPVLSNVHSDALHLDEVPRLTEEWLRTAERVFEIQLALGRCREALTELRPAAHAHPLHERFWEQLIEALHRTGRRAEALAEYRRVEVHLRSELGVGPGPALRHLEAALRTGEPWPPARSPAPEGGPARVGGRRPGPPGALVARGDPSPPDRTDPPNLAGVPGPTYLPDLPDLADLADPPERRAAGGRGFGPGPDAPATGEFVLASLVRAGLLEEWPPGRYRVHELLRTFTRAATHGRSPAPPDRRPDRSERPDRTDHADRTERQDRRPRQDRTDRPDRPDRSECPRRPERPAVTDHPADRPADRPVQRAAAAPGPAGSPRQPAAPLRTTEV